MKQVIPTLSGAVIGGGFPSYVAVGGTAFGLNNETTANTRWPATGVFRNWKFELDTAPGVGNSWTITVRKEIADTSVVMTISDLDTSVTYASPDLAVSENNRMTVRWTPSGTAATTTVRASVEFESTAEGESAHVVHSTQDNDFLTQWNGVFVGAGAFNTTSAGRVTNIVAVDGTIAAFYIQSSAAPGGAASWTYTIYKNGVKQDGSGGTVNTSVVLSGGTSASGTFALPVSAGDSVYLECVASSINGPSDSGSFNYSIRFVADADGEYNVCGGSAALLSASTTRYHVGAQGQSSTPGFVTTESGETTPGAVSSVVLSGLRVLLDGSPGSGKNYTFTLRNNSATPSGAPTASIADAATNAYVGGTMTVVSGDRWGIRGAPSGTPTVRYASWGMSARVIADVDILQKVTQAVLLVGYDEDADLDVPDEASPCGGGGTVPSGSNPIAGNSLIGATNLRAWLEVDIFGTSPSLTERFAKEAINDEARKEPRVLEFGTVIRALTNQFDGLETARITTRMSDWDGKLKGYERARALLRQRVRYYIADVTTIQAGDSPWQVFNGVVADFRAESDGTFTLTCEDALTTAGGSFSQEQPLPPELISGTISDRTPTDYLLDKPVPGLYGSLSDEDLGADAVGVVPGIYTQQTSEFDTEIQANLDMYLFQAGALTNLQNAFGADFLTGGGEPTTRARFPPSAWGSWAWAPGMTGWPFDDYVEFSGRRYFAIFLDQSHIVSKLAREGRIPLTANFCGREDVGDGTGTMIDNPAYVLAHIINNHWLQEASEDWLNQAEADGYSILDTDSFDAVAALCDDLSLKCAGILGHSSQQITGRELLASFARSFGFDVGINRHGQVMLSMLDRNEGSYTREYNDVSYIPEESIEHTSGVTRQVNERVYAFKRNYISNLPDLTPTTGARLPTDPTKGQWRSGRQTLARDASIDALGGRPMGVRPSQLQELDWVEDPATAGVVQSIELDLWAYDRQEVTFPVRLVDGGAEDELGSIILVRHRMLPGSPRRCQIRRIETDLDEFYAKITALDIENLFGLEISAPGVDGSSPDGNPVVVNYPPVIVNGNPVDNAEYDIPDGSQFPVGVTPVIIVVPDDPEDPVDPDPPVIVIPVVITEPGATPGSQVGLPIIPGGYGFGMTTRAAYGGVGDPIVIRIDTLNPEAPLVAVGDGTYRGGFRPALVWNTPRIVIFETSGDINLGDAGFASNVLVDWAPYLYVAGQTAPSPGIRIIGGAIQIQTHDVLLRHIRIRPGDGGPVYPQTANHDACIAYSSPYSTPPEPPTYNVVLANCSFSWAGGKNCELVSISLNANATVWRCIISEAMSLSRNVSVSADQFSGLGLLMSNSYNHLQANFSAIGNVLAHNNARNPELQGPISVHWINNMVYNWGKYPGHPYPWAGTIQNYRHSDGNVYDGPKVASIGNRYIAGSPPYTFTPIYTWMTYGYPQGIRLYLSDNSIDQSLQAVTEYINYMDSDPRVGSSPVSLTGITVNAASTVEAFNVANAGARPLDRDVVDTRIVNEITNRTGRIIASQNQVGGLVPLAVNRRSITLPTTPHTIQPSGYTVLEEFLNALADQLEP